MQRIILLLLFAAFMSHMVSAQKITADKIPATVISAFNAKFSNAAKVSWEMENSNEYESTFKLNNREMSANFDASGKWLETETEIKVSDLRAAVTTALQKDFDGFKIVEASQVESSIHGLCYEAEIEKGEESYDVLFSGDGKLISKIKLEEEEEDDKD